MSMGNCKWIDVFDDESLMTTEKGVFITGLLSFILSGWLTVALFATDLCLDLSYRNLAFFPLASLIRCSLLISSYIFNYTERYDTENGSCKLSGFWNSFLSVYEVECLTHICIERYVVAKYITNGWSLNQNHYALYQSLCVFFATLYSLPPIFGLGSYGLDFSCKECTLDMVLPDTWDRYVVIIIFLLKSVKSTGFILTMLVWARQREARYDSSEKLVKQLSFTRTVIIITIVNLVCWAPLVVTRGWVVISYLLYNEMETTPSTVCVQWAMWSQWVAPALTTIAIFLVDQKLRQKMINIVKVSGEIKENDKKE